MFKQILALAALLVCCGIAAPLLAQNDPDPKCSPVIKADSVFSVDVFFNFGSTTDVFSNRYRSSFTLGESVVNNSVISKDNQTQFGFWSNLLVAPSAPIVKASQGELLDRIQITWEPNPLGAQPTEGFKLYRDGVFLALLDIKTRNYNDFNVIAGRPYVYEVRGINFFGEGSPGKAEGFQVPNGVVTGWIRTPKNGKPVPDALVALTPLQGFSARFGPADGAFAVADTGTAGSLIPPANGEWSLAFWVKTDHADASAGIISLHQYPLLLRPIASGMHEGIEVALSDAGPALMSGQFPDSTKNGWHHVTFTMDADGMGRLYINGTLTGIAPVPPMPSAEELRLGARTEAAGTWTGKLDELRIYHRRLDELDLGEVMMGTASSQTPNLKYYWKMDEELGTGSFDVARAPRNKLFFCGPQFDADRPYVRTMGKTNQEGYYRIESASYGTGTTFLAEPMKDFYMYRALKFKRDDADYATLPNFSLTKKSTLELWVNSAGPDGTQCLLSKKWAINDFQLLLKPNGTKSDVYFYLNGDEHNFGTLDMNYQHLAFTIDSSGSTRTVTAYKNGQPFGTPHTFGGVSSNWSDPAGVWVMGARPSGGSYTDHYGGLIDEFAVYDTTLSEAKIFDHFKNGRSPQERGLRAYFALDEGGGNRLHNSGSVLTNSGTKSPLTQWTPFTARQKTEPREFAPDTRQVTLNPSVTSVDQVDFEDRSTIPVYGRVRYANTDCFAQNVEILVDGESYSPKIFTDSTGSFSISFDPGSNATLTPKYEDHTFDPPSWELMNVVNPVAGITFSDTKTRKIKGQIAGGLCRKSIIAGAIDNCIIKVATRDECFVWEQKITNTDGHYEFNPLPPLEVTIAIIDHRNKKIYDDFQVQGGREINLTKKDSTGVDFIYIAPPTVGVDGFENYLSPCKDPANPLLPLPDIDGNPLVVVEEDDLVSLDINVYEQYGTGVNDVDNRCLLDSALLSIDNTFDKNYNFLEPIADTMRNKKYDYDFRAAFPNPNEPYLKIMQVTADVNGRKGTFVRRALITGIIKGERKFTTVTPVMPNFILRDPPGDGSYAYIEKGETICNTMSIENSSGNGPYFTLETGTGIDNEISVPPTPKILIKALTGLSGSFDARFVQTTKTSTDFCLTATERISTDDGDLVVGGESYFDNGNNDIVTAGNDVYVGTAFNLIISDSKYLRFSPDTCEVKLNTVTTIESDSFATTYMYSEWNIKNNVIRYLDSLILDGQNPNGIASRAKQRWEEFVKMNKLMKGKATFKKNISWDAGTQYAYSETRDTTKRAESGTIDEFTGSVGLLTEIEAVSVGGGASRILLDAGAKFEGSFTEGTGEFTKKGLTVGYVLKDDDPGDTWTMDVKDDPIFKTPVFEIKAGQTSCPWEVGTAHREGMKLVSLDGNTRLNVPSNGQAAFKFQLQNNSQSGETFTYSLTTGPESNPHGAKIFLNGAPLDHYVYYAIPWGTTLDVTVTVERGPTEYNYDLLELVLLSECHDRRCNTLGMLPDLEPYLYSAVYLSVQFEEPCSEVDINSPRDGWVVKSDPGNPIADRVEITVTDYDKKDPDLLGIRLQWRREGGDDAWINITNHNQENYIHKADLGEVYTVYPWNTGGVPPLSDGPYEIRAVAVCDGAPTDNPGFSHIIKGSIDREPPSIFGLPEPSDGSYNVGDEISFTFNQPISCLQKDLIQADIFNPNNVGLYDATTNTLVQANITCYGNKIVIDPVFDNEFFENRLLRAELHDIKDLVGNGFNGTRQNMGIWEFYVDRNELAWLTDSMGITKYEGEYKVGTAAIHNRAGYPVKFSITGAPSWVRVVPSAGTLVANQILPIRFEVDSTLAFGNWSGDVVLHTEPDANIFFMGGDEPLPIGVRVVCRPPNWKFSPNIYENTMNVVLELNIEGEVSTDVEDIAAAFIHDTLRGYAHVEYVPAIQKYLAYMTIYGDPDDQLDDVRFEIWDASGCLRYGSVVETLTFQPDNVIGSAANPQVLHTSGLVLREVPFGYGWNWLSFNLQFPLPDPNSALASLKHPENDLMKSQGPFATYMSGNNGGWFGNLTALTNTTMYIYRADVPDTLRMLGNLIDPTATPIPLVTGWNWIGYIPSYSLSLNDALSSLPSQLGDVIKSQYAFAQYFNSTFGWVGNLKYMSPPNGYQIKVATPGTLTYPPPTQVTGDPVESRGESEKELVAFWTVNPAQYEHSMTLIGMLKANGQNATTATMELGVFVGNEVRGSAQAVYIPPLDAYQFFLTTYANVGGEQLRFKLFDSASGTVQDLTETMWFTADLHQGSIESPVPFSLKTSGLVEVRPEQSLDVQPNPFSEETLIRFALPRSEEVVLSVMDLNGREVSRLRVQARAGLNTVTWDGTSDAGLRLSGGVYLVRLHTDGGGAVQKVVLHR